MAGVLLGEEWARLPEEAPLVVPGFAEENIVADREAEQQREVEQVALLREIADAISRIPAPVESASVMAMPPADHAGMAAAISTSLAPLVQSLKPADPAPQLAALAQVIDKMDRRVAAGALGGGPGGGTDNSILATIRDRMAAGSLYDSANIRTTAMGANETFTGTWSHISEYGGLIFLWALLVTDGQPTSVQVQFSNDQSTVASTQTLVAEVVEGAPGVNYNVWLLLQNGSYPAAYYRVKVVQGATPTSGVPINIAVRNQFPFNGTYSGLDATLTFFSQALLTRSVFAGLNPNMDFTNERIGGSLTNSPTPSLLNPSGVYTSDWYPSTGFVSIALLITTDQVSAGNGIEVQFSLDGSTVHRRTQRTYSASDVTNGSKFVAFANQGNYFRLIYTNGGVTQTVFSLGFRMNTTAIQQAVDGVEADISPVSSATMVRNVLAAKSDAGVYGNVTRSTVAGGLRVSIAEAEVDVPIKALTTFSTGQATVSSSTTPVAIISSPLSGRKTFTIKALAGNTKKVYVGTSGVTTGNGFELNAGESITLEVDTTTAPYMVGETAASQTVCFAQVA